MTKLSNLSVQWEWEGEKSVWQQFSTDIQEKISKAFDDENKEVKNRVFFCKMFSFLIEGYCKSNR